MPAVWGQSAWGADQIPAGGSSDTTPPVVTIISPVPGSFIQATTQIRFQITDNSGSFRRILPAVKWPDGRYEIIHDGEGFTPDYAGSTRTPITNGFEYLVARVGGWKANPTLVPFAYDLAGNEPP